MRPEPKRDWRTRARDILQTADLVDDLLRAMDGDAFRQSLHTQAALVTYLARIGEAANHIPEPVRQQAADVPWREIRGMRNILVHVYWEVSVDVLWLTGKEAVPSLARSLNRLLEQDDGVTGAP